jgi:hypothetical protein
MLSEVADGQSGVDSPPPPRERSSRSGSKRKRSEQERRDRHNDTERKGRQKINSEITALKELLPELQNAVSPKANVLQCAVDNIKRLQSLCQQLLNTNMNMKDENKKLWAEVNRLRAVLNPHDSLLCEILEQKLGQQDNGFAFPGPLAPPPVAPVSMTVPLSQHDACMRNSELLVSSNGNIMGFPLAATRQMWCYPN